MPLKLIHGPPNSGRRGLIRRLFTEALDRDPVLVVPNVDDVHSFELELCEGGATLGGSVMALSALFRASATVAGAPPGPALTASQRRQMVAVAVERRRASLGPLGRAAGRPGFPAAFTRLLDELQAAGLEPRQVESAAGTLDGSAYLSDVATVFAAYEELREELGRADTYAIEREAIEQLGRHGEAWEGRPVFLYGLDDLTGNQFALIAALAHFAEVTIALPYEEGRPVLAARADVLERLRAGLAVAEEIRTQPVPENTSNPLLFHLERHLGAANPPRRPAGDGLAFLCSAGARGEAEAIGAEVARLLRDGARPDRIAIALRDPARRGPAIDSVLASYGIPTALEAELPVGSTSVGGALIALVEAEFGAARAADLLRYLRGPSGVPPEDVDRFERSARQRRAGSARAALELWSAQGARPLADLERLREAAGESPPALAAAAAGLAEEMATRHLRDAGDAPELAPEDEIEMRAANTIARALRELAELGALAPRPEQLATVIAGIGFRAWMGSVAGRVRIASPYRLRAERFEHVFVASLQDGEFPRREGGADPFLSERQRAALGLGPRREGDAEERYLFYTCVSLASKRLYLSYRDSDADGGAEIPSPLLDEVRRLLDPNRPPTTLSRDIGQVVHAVGSAPSERELARAIAAHGPAADLDALLATAAPADAIAGAVEERLLRARAAEEATRAPGPLRNQAVLKSLAATAAFGGTTLEEFDLCSYRWFVAHELAPRPLGPDPDPLLEGGLMHAALERLYRERPGGSPLPRIDSLGAWSERARELVADLSRERGLGSHPAERAMARRVERLLLRFLAEEAERESGGFEPWLLEAEFGEGEDSERPALELDGWRLHGKIDRVDRGPGNRAVVIDYKLARSVTPRDKFEERAKLQLPLYLLAVSEQWGAEPAAGLYYPLRGTSSRRPRGLVLEEAREELTPYRLTRTDIVDRDSFAAALDEAHARAGRVVERIRRGDIRRDPGPRPGLRGHDLCPAFCEFATVCRRDRAGRTQGNGEDEGE